MIENKKGSVWPISPEELRHIPEGEPFICMFSGGKDCALALSIARQHGQVRGLIHCLDVNSGMSMFHMQSQKVVERQADAINLPLTITNYSALNYWPKLVRTYKQYAQQGIKSVVFGDLFLEANAKLQATVCQSAGLIPRMPLWEMPKEYLIQEIKARGIKSVITAIRSPALTDSWLGKVFDEHACKSFAALGIDPFGENGEFHTTLIDADFFQKPLDCKFNEEVYTFRDARMISMQV